MGVAAERRGGSGEGGRRLRRNHGLRGSGVGFVGMPRRGAGGGYQSARGKREEARGKGEEARARMDGERRRVCKSAERKSRDDEGDNDAELFTKLLDSRFFFFGFYLSIAI